MKSYEERAREILESRDRILKEKKIKRKKIEKCLVGTFSLCTILVILINFRNRNETYTVNNSEYVDSQIDDEDTEYEQGDVNIYYVANGKLEYRTEYLSLSSKHIFECWKSYNRIGEDVKLINIKIDNNGLEYTDSNVEGYIVGDKYAMNITISNTLEKYYNYYSKELLIESLKQTFLGYSDDVIDEFNLILE